VQVPVLPRLISGVVRGLAASFPFIVLAGGWPSALIAIISLGLPLVGAYFPRQFHCYFKPKGGGTSWFTPSALKTTRLPEGVGLLVSGSKQFIDGIMGTVGPTRQIIASVETSLRGVTLRGLRKSRASGKELLKRHGMQPVSFLDSGNGGATNACHVLGFGRDLGLDVLPTASKGLPLTLRHFLDGGAKGAFPKTSRVPRLSVSVVDVPPRSVLWHLDVVLGEGLFPCTRPHSLVYYPSHFFPGQWIWRTLTLPELLRLYWLPLSLDPLLRDLDPERGLPFEDAPATDVFVSIFRHFLGGCGGLVLGLVSVETPNCGGGKIGKDSVELDDSLAVELEDSLAVELEEENWDVEKDVENWDVKKDVETKSKCRDAYTTKCRAAGAGPPTPSPSIMTADTGLETQGRAGVEVIGPPAAWQFDFGDSFGDLFGGLTDKDMVTSMASKVTLAWSSRGDKQEMGS
jgi:hypothetical protein